MSFRIRDLMISVLTTAGGRGCQTCTGTTGDVRPQPQLDLGCKLCTGTTHEPQLYGNYGCNACTGTIGQLGMGCPTCTGTTGGYGCGGCTGTTPHLGGGCPTCTGTTGQVGGGCPACTGTTGGFCAHAAALAACGVCTGVSPALGDQRPQALALLREQLQGLLAEVEAEEQRLADAAFPQTAEETEALEKKLEEALAEVRSRKAAFGKKKKG